MFTYLLMFYLATGSYAQQKKTFFSDAISLHIKSYKESCNRAVWNGDFDKLDILFDSLVNNHLKGTRLNELKIKMLEGGSMDFTDNELPILLTTTSGWFFKNKEEIEALNTLAEEFANSMKVIVLFWDTRKNIKDLAKQYNEFITIVYVDETSNADNDIINTYKHALGIPATFYVASDQTIVDINRGGLIKYYVKEEKEFFATNYSLYQKHIMKLLLKDELLRNTILSNTD
ncbi:MAG: redoxin domain-containing protein [Flavobacteriaceae bacterium]|nr:redoxin domain-containing protein [Bacteroidia bacterium]MBT8286421.1 redoxin domain-containing protein [Bacteroidia bacterium]NNF75922.1 redoxin domain-containing protein [Flavobacteriaceae bacterium]NNK72743.1 redoxin domain-containing protein [Flavobacteriaceae bacterium]